MRIKSYISSYLIFLIFCFITLGCTDDDMMVCKATRVTMEINGEMQNFQALGRGIDSRENGFELQLNLSRRSNDPSVQQGISIVLPYKETGENIITEFIYTEFTDSTTFSGDFINGTLKNDVLTNNRFCFYATFSGSLSDGSQQIVISNGELSFEYELPFDE